MERRTFLARCGVAGGAATGVVPVATARRSTTGGIPAEAEEAAAEAIRNGNVEKAKDIFEKHDVYYVHSRKEPEVPAYTKREQSESGATFARHIAPSGTFDLWARKKYDGGEHNGKHLFNLYWNWDVENGSGSATPYDSVAISWSETAYRPVAGTNRYDSSLDNGGAWRVEEDIHEHGYKFEYPLVIDSVSPGASGFIEIVTELRDIIGNGTTLYMEYIHTWERFPFNFDIGFSLPGPASLTLDTSSWRIGEWKESDQLNYDPH